ncbi:DUF922 domain-containing protein [uncultured Algibacter sp.]|uniref:DUF922 domain-containing protein n=1 Tax=uncultured Algibacter sp. TaxID=298659 RepID=UPI0032176945
MIRTLLIICCFFTLQQDESVISWHASYKLVWDDFKGKPNNNIEPVATTASGITFGFSVTKTEDDQVVSFTSEVFAHFYPEHSWYKPELANNHILGHEQLHFDITELHVRKFRQRIKQLEVSNTLEKDLNKIHLTINKELAQMQDNYDDETDYSRNFESQAKWQTNITDALDKLSVYKSIE